MSFTSDAHLNQHVAPIIGYHRAPLSQKFGAPRQPNLVTLTSIIEMMTPYDMPAAFVGLEDFSHIWISWQFHQNYLIKENQRHNHNHNHESKDNHDWLNKPNNNFRPQVRPPRLGGNQKIGVFASRSMYRPSALGLSVVKLERLEVVDGRVLLLISGADMIDGTPIIDIKPYVAYSDALPDAKSGFAPSAPTLLEVIISQVADKQFLQIVNNQSFIDEGDKNNNRQKPTVKQIIDRTQKQLLISDLDVIKALIAQDPRPAYRRLETNTVFVMRYKSVDISFQFLETGELQIINIVAVLLN